MNQPAYPIQACTPFEKRYAGYFTPNATVDPVVKCHGELAVTADFISTGVWDLTLVDQAQLFVHAKAWAIDDGTDIVEIQVLSIADKVVRVRCRRAADLAGTLAVSNSCDKVAFEFVTLTVNSPGNGF